MKAVSGQSASVATRRLRRVAVLTVAGAIGSASQAEAALYYWSNPDAGYWRPGPMVQPRPHKPHHHQAKKIEAPANESAKPQGPLIIAISIEKQNLRIYDANGFFAETPISTGMKGHPTPMGVFSVIQKQKLHHSNIYSGAPMPYMQRITWSGVAMHAGVLPGYPASHGCIRMPMAFAVKMWNWTKMGARVTITPGEITPSSFSHPLLVAQKVVPAPNAEPQADTPVAPKSDKASEADTPIGPAISVASLDLRSTIGHGDAARLDTTPLRDQTHTADAGDMTAAQAPVTMTDATSSAGNAPPPEEASAAGESKAADAPETKAKSETAKSEAEAAGKPGEIVSSDDKPTEPKSAEIATAETKPAATDKPDQDGKKPDEAQTTAPSNRDSANVETSATGSLNAEAGARDKPDEKKVEAKADHVKAEALQPDAPGSDAPKSSEKPEAGVKAITGVSPGAADVKKDQARLPDPAKPAAASKPAPAMAAAPKRSGQIAVFISRKDSKLYVRQNFAPLFDVPVTIAPSDRPLGTHVFTAQVDRDDANVLHWSVVSLPMPSRYAERRDEDERISRRRKTVSAVEMKPLPVPDSPAEALDRLTIPLDAMARITEALSTGASIIVSDQGITAGETGEGTDFIVSLR
jgi:L,D-transpeptidase catalytic domain